MCSPCWSSQVHRVQKAKKGPALKTALSIAPQNNEEAPSFHGPGPALTHSYSMGGVSSPDAGGMRGAVERAR